MVEFINSVQIETIANATNAKVIWRLNIQKFAKTLISGDGIIKYPFARNFERKTNKVYPEQSPLKDECCYKLII